MPDSDTACPLNYLLTTLADVSTPRHLHERIARCDNEKGDSLGVHPVLMRETLPAAATGVVRGHNRLPPRYAASAAV